MSRKCIVCGRPIPKRGTYYTFSLPRPAVPAMIGGFSMAAQPAREPGDRVASDGGMMVTLYVAELPRTRAEAQRLVNGQIISTRKSRFLDGIEHATAWDGESYRSLWFDVDRCAIAQGNASAQHGARFKWQPA